MHLSKFQHLRAATAQEAAELLKEHGPDALLVAGGTDLFPRIKYRLIHPETVVSLKGVSVVPPDVTQNNELRLDALMPLADVGSSPLVKERAPMPGMSKGVILWVRERREEEIIRVDLCPTWFAKIRDTGIRRGEFVHVKGVFVEIDGEDVFMASKIKKGDWEFKVRLTKDGTPFWTMGPEQLAKERAAK